LGGAGLPRNRPYQRPGTWKVAPRDEVAAEGRQVHGSKAAGGKFAVISGKYDAAAAPTPRAMAEN